MGRADPPPPVQARTRLLSSWTSAAKEASLPEIRQRHDRDEGHLEPVRHLFAATAEITETAHEAAIAGQLEVLSAGDYAAKRLQATARGIAALAEAAAVIPDPSDRDSSGRADQMP